MNASQYAAHRGVTPEAIRYSIKVGKLKESLIPSIGKQVLIDADIADKELVLERRVVGEKQIESPGADPQTEKTPYLADSRARKEAADAQLAELKLEREKGKLLDADEVKQAAFKAARFTRDAMLNIPDRVSTEFAAETDAFKIHSRLNEEIKKALEGLKLEE